MSAIQERRVTIHSIPESFRMCYGTLREVLASWKYEGYVPGGALRLLLPEQDDEG